MKIELTRDQIKEVIESCATYKDGEVYLEDEIISFEFKISEDQIMKEDAPKTIIEILKWVQDGSIYLDDAENLLKQLQAEAITKAVKMAVEMIAQEKEIHISSLLKPDFDIYDDIIKKLNQLAQKDEVIGRLKEASLPLSTGINPEAYKLRELLKELGE